MKLSLYVIVSLAASVSMFSQVDPKDVPQETAPGVPEFCETANERTLSTDELPRWVLDRGSVSAPELKDYYIRADLAYRSAALQVRLNQTGSATLQAASEERFAAAYQLKTSVCSTYWAEAKLQPASTF